MDPNDIKKQEILFLGIFAFLATWLVWWPSLNVMLVADDFMILNHLKEGGPWGIWSSPGQGWFRPLVSLSFWLDMQLYSDIDKGLHITNLLLLSFSAWMTGLVAYYWLQGSSLWTPRIAALIFALLPSHAEAVCWVAGRTDLLSSALAGASLVRYLQVRSRKQTSWQAMIPAWILFAMGLCAKEAILTLPLGLFLLEWHFNGKPRIHWAWKQMGIWFFLMVIYIPIRAYFVGEWVGGYGSQVHLHISPVRLFAQPFLSVGRALLPSLGGVGELLGIHQLFILKYGALFCYGGFTLGLLYLLRKHRFFWIWLGVAVSFMLPSLSLGFQAETSLLERFMFFPSIALSILTALILQKIQPPRSRIRTSFAIVGLSLLLGSCSLFSAHKWAQAGKLTQKLVQQVIHRASSSLVILGVPDHQDGALVLRSGLQEAIQYNQRQTPQTIIPAIYSRFASQPQIEVKQQKDFLALTPRHPLSRWYPSAQNQSWWKISEDQRTLWIQTSKLPAPFLILNP